jgi:lysophospholipase L1-like esterase
MKRKTIIFVVTLTVALTVTLAAQFLRILNAHPGPVILLGDSIAWGWKPSFPTVNVGQRGETSAAALQRWHEMDTSGNSAVVIMVGINDIESGISDDSFDANLREIIWVAKQRGLRIVVCSMPPSSSAIEDLLPRAEMQHRNAMLRDIAAKTHVAFADIYTALVGNDGYGQPSLLADSMHPNGDGYRVIEAVVMQAMGN